MAIIIDFDDTNDAAAYREARCEHAIWATLTDANEAALSDPSLVEVPGRGTIALSRMQALRDAAFRYAAIELAREDPAFAAQASSHNPGSPAVGRLLMAREDGTERVMNMLGRAAAGDLGGRALPAWQGHLDEFDRVAGIASETGEQRLTGDEHGLLVTPTSALWRGRLCMAASGGHEALLSSDATEAVAQEMHVADAIWPAMSVAPVRMTAWPIEYYNGAGNVPTPIPVGASNGTGGVERNPDGTLGIGAYGWADASGLTSLAPYSDPETFHDIVFSVAGSWPDTLAREGEMGPSATNMRRATRQIRQVLDILADEGHDVKLRAGGLAGTVEAVIDDGAAYVRVLDQPGQSRFVGRTFADGAIWRLPEPEAVSPTRDADVAALEATTTAERRGSLVRLALGEDADALAGTWPTAHDRNVMRLDAGTGEVVCEWTPESTYTGVNDADPMGRVVEMARSARIAIAHDALTPDGGGSDAALARDEAAGEADPKAAVEAWLDERIGDEAAVRAGHCDWSMVARNANGRGEQANMRTITAAIRRECQLAVTDPAHHHAIDSDGAPGVVRAATLAFDASTARGEDAMRPFEHRCAEAVRETLASRGLADATVAIDSQGVMRWSASKHMRHGSDVGMVGLVGQVFEPSPTGEVSCDLADRQGFAIEPSMAATVAPRRLSAGMPSGQAGIVDRMRVTGGLDGFVAGLRRQVSRDVLSVSGPTGTGDVGQNPWVGSPVSANRLWRSMSGERHELGVSTSRDSAESHLTESFDALRRDAERRRVRLPKWMHEGSTTYGIIEGVEAPDRDVTALTCDLWPSGDAKPLVESGLADLSSMSAPQFAGVFDPDITAQGRDQGLNRTLVEGASVRDGHLVRSADENDKAPITKDVLFSTIDDDTWLRRQLATSNTMHALDVTEPVQVAHVAFGGFEQDDAVVVSKAFAEAHPVSYEDADGNVHERPLGVNDKVSDVHGNKGLVSLVIDPDMDDETADRLGIRRQRDTFRDNPDLACVMSPFSFISRGNAGTAREGMADPRPVTIDGERHEAGSCMLRMVVQQHTADEKSSVYDGDTPEWGGRKVGWQLTAGLSALGADGLLHEMFGGNEAGLARMREAMRTVGFDLDKTGRVVHGIVDDGRPEVALPSMDRQTECYLNRQGEVRYGRVVMDADGSVRTDRDGNPKHSVLFTASYTAEAAVSLAREGGVSHLAMPLDHVTKAKDGSYLLPVMGVHARSGSEFVDERPLAHDYSAAYVSILEDDQRYRLAKAAADRAREEGGDPKPFADEMERVRMHANDTLEGIVDSVVAREIESHDNVFKTCGLSNRVRHSATLPWSPDPRLDVQELAIGREDAERLGITSGDAVVLWRDPVLTSDCVRSFTAKVEDGLKGLQVNPVVAGTIGGDFDGDTVGIYVPQTEEGIRDAREKLSFGANLLDDAHADVHEDADLDFGLGLDIRLAEAFDPSVADDFEQLRQLAVRMDGDAQAQDGNAEDAETREQFLPVLNLAIHGAQDASFGHACLSYASAEDNVRSIWEACVKTGVKGSEEKLAAYARNLGCEVTTPDGHMTEPDGTRHGSWRDGCIHDTGHTLLTRDDDEQTQFATHAKAAYTGISGHAMQVGLMLATKPEEVRAATVLTEQIYQHTLDYKTDASAARQETPAIACLSGLLSGQAYEMPVRYEPDVHGGQRPVFERRPGKPGQLSPEEFRDQFRQVSQVFGIRPNERALETVSEAKALRGPELSYTGMGGSAMHVLAFQPRRALDRLETYAEHGVRLYDGPVTRELAPDSVREAMAARDRVRAARQASVALAGVDYAASASPTVQTQVQAAPAVQAVTSTTQVQTQARLATHATGAALDTDPHEGPKGPGDE